MTTPCYRFWGRTAPNPERTRVPILASAPSSRTDDNGVATLRLYDPIDSWGGYWGLSAAEFTKTLDELEDVTEIRLHINSPGGEVFEAIAILNALRRHEARVVAIVDGIAASAASFIAAGADEMLMAPNSELMIHDAWGLCVGNAGDMRDLATRLDQFSDNIASIYAKKAGGDVADWRAAMLAETWYSHEEAVAAGLADGVEGEDADQSDEAAKDRYDLSIFSYAGREEAPAPTAPTTPAPEASTEDETEPSTDDAIALRHRVNARRSRARR